MEIDTRAGVSLVSEQTVNSSFMKSLPLHPTYVRLCTYTGEVVPELGKLIVSVVKDKASITLPLLVVKGEGTTLLGIQTGYISYDSIGRQFSVYIPH